MIDRVMRAAMLNVNLYEEVEADTSLNQEALQVVIIVSVLSGVGAFLSGLIGGGGFLSGILGLILAVVLGIGGYFIWAYITHWVATSFFKGTGDVGEVLRTLGYASGPRALAVFAFIPCLGGLVGLVGALWSLATGVIAIRQAMELDTTNAVITVVIGWVIVFVITVILGTIFGLGAFGLGALTGGLR